MGYPFSIIKLPYSFDALEPFIDAKTVEIHYTRHLQGYVNKLNELLAGQPELQNLSLEQLVMNAAVPQAIRNQAGGVFNHNAYFTGMSARCELAGDLKQAIKEQWQTKETFEAEFKLKALSVFGSGYTWLVKNSETNLLSIETSANQNVPDLNVSNPILCLDVWEHAYYLKHYGNRSAYIDAWFNVINWTYANRLFA